MTFMDYLDELVNKAQLNVYDYEEFHQDKLANIPSMKPIDAFLYGVASGKLEMAKHLRNLIEDLMEKQS